MPTMSQVAGYYNNDLQTIILHFTDTFESVVISLLNFSNGDSISTTVFTEDCISLPYNYSPGDWCITVSFPDGTCFFGRFYITL